jgi:hypothetical protein
VLCLGAFRYALPSYDAFRYIGFCLVFFYNFAWLRLVLLSCIVISSVTSDYLSDVFLEV